jgi:signal transduction histidine kinase/CheY-like chemotaxis protein
MKKQLGQLLAGNNKLRRPVFIGLACAFASLWLVVTLTFSVWSGYERSESLAQLVDKIDEQLGKEQEYTAYQMLQISQKFIGKEQLGHLLKNQKIVQAKIEVLRFKQSIPSSLSLNRLTMFTPSLDVLFTTPDRSMSDVELSTKYKPKGVNLSKQLTLATQSNDAEQGISISSAGEITLNAVLPIRHENIVVGYLQLSKLLSSLTTSLADTNKIDIHLLTHKSVINQDDYEYKINQSKAKDNWQFLDSFILSSDTVNKFDIQALSSVLNDTDQYTTQKDTYYQEYTGSKDVPMQLALLPIQFVNEHSSAFMLVIVDNSSAYSAYEFSLLVNNVSFTIITLIVFVLFWYFLGNIEKNIYVAEQQLIKTKNLAEQNRDDAEKAKNEAEKAKGEAEKSRHQAEQANKIKSEFLAKMSHELRTPLNAIIGITEMMQEDAREFDDEDYIEPLGRVLRAGKHLLSLINDILDLSKIESGKMELYPESFELKLFINDIERIIEPLVNKNSNQMVVSIDKNISKIYADSTRVKQILLNLLSNACKFTDEGKICLMVSPSLIDKEQAVSFSIIDEGIGMNEQQLSMLFQDFQQVDSSSTRKYEGTGLGLSISQKFAELMGGNITVSSEADKGSIFTVTLPLGFNDKVTEEPRNGTLPNRPEHRRKLYVLVVENDDYMISMLNNYFDKQAVDIDIVNNVTDAISKARMKKPNLITLNINMPGINASDTLTIIKSDNNLCDIPVIAFTENEERKISSDMGADEYLNKPVKKEDIEEIFSRFINQKEL